jgi:hypothetical protein
VWSPKYQVFFKWISQAKNEMNFKFYMIFLKSKITRKLFSRSEFFLVLFVKNSIQVRKMLGKSRILALNISRLITVLTKKSGTFQVVSLRKEPNNLQN